MNDDKLSQDEINELLKGVNLDDDNGSSDMAEDLANLNANNDEGYIDVNNYLTPIEQDAIGEIGNISFGSAATALSTLLNQKVDITTPQVTVVKKDLLDREFPQPHVAISVEYTEGFEGMNLLVMRTHDAKIIADLMMGGDGTNPPEELNELQISAVQEAMNQMMGSASTSMSTIFNKKVDTSPPGVDILDLQNNRGYTLIPDDDILVKVQFSLKVGDLIDSSIMQLLSVNFAKQLVEDLMNPSSGDDLQFEPPSQEPAPSVGEPSTQVTVPEQPSMQTPPPQQQQMPSAQPAMQGGFENRTQQYLGSPFSGQRHVDVQPAVFSSFTPPDLTESESKNLSMLLDIPLQVSVELGRTKRSIKEILEFTQGSIIELDKLAGEPVDILVNQKLIAKGEVVVIDENFGVRVTEIVSQEDRLNKLR